MDDIEYVINFINDVTWNDCGRYEYGTVPKVRDQVIELLEELRELRKIKDTSISHNVEEQYCHWYQQDFQYCETWATCDNKLFNVLNGTPSENEMHFCPYCGKTIVEHNYNEQFEDEIELIDDN